jgi:hypothetical protein
LTAHDLYIRAEPNYVGKLDLSLIAPKIQYHELEDLLRIISKIENDSKMFDTPNHIRFNRKSFADLSFADKIKIPELIDEIVSIANTNSPILMASITQQQELVTSLETLSRTTGMFRKFKSAVKDANETARKLINDPRFLSGDSDLLDPLVKELVTLEPTLDGARRGQELWNSLQKLTAFINETGFSWLTSDISKNVIEKEKLLRKLSLMKGSFLEDYERIHEYDQNKKLLTDLQLQIMEICISKLIGHVGWSEILRQEFYLHWLQIIEHENPVLRTLPFEVYTENCKRLAAELKKHKLLTTKNISEGINSEIIRPGTTRSGRESSRNNPVLQMWSSLGGDLERKRRVLTVRALIQKYESIIFSIAPCWLASPEAVSSVFPLRRNLFDFVIFDEASQSAVERSLTTLYRGNHIVNMGDEKQLRPFNLFRLSEEEEEEAFDDTIDDSMISESLLVLAKRTYRNRNLVWHYRSKYQELIDFSNHAFYDGRLQVAPNILRAPKNPPIRWIKCQNGLWEDRQNIPEAHLVVDVIKENLKENGERHEFRSIGIITFNERQRSAILDEIDRRRKSDLEFDQLYANAENPPSKNLDDRPFVKNIENVQGDERDIIIFSVGYARDVDGNLHIQFGTLTLANLQTPHIIDVFFSSPVCPKINIRIWLPS